jgi:hypothetical protein
MQRNRFVTRSSEVEAMTALSSIAAEPRLTIEIVPTSLHGRARAS